MLKNPTLSMLARTAEEQGKPIDLDLLLALDSEMQASDLQPTDQELVALSDMVDLTYDGGKNGFQEEADLSESVSLFARAVLCKYGRQK